MSTSNNAVHNNVIPVIVKDEMKKHYLDYSMSVIVARALPDVCDGLKPVHRRILYTMYEGGYHYDKPFKKSARIVGDVMGKYHPHGDAAIYDALVRMAQDFSMAVPLVDGQGNFGSIDDDPPAAMRYTESRLKKISHTLVEDIDKDTVDFQPNYDNSESEPMVLPARYPNILVNGSSGIAVGMATNIPPHNLGEVITATIATIKNSEITDDELLEIVPGPDFPTSAMILGRNGYISAAKTGKGTVILRSKSEIVREKNGREYILVKEIPYQVNKAALIQKIAELVNDKRILGISDLRDESDRDGVRIIIELKKDVQADVILNQLYNFTQLQTNFSINMLAINGRKPELMGLKKVLDYFIKFRRATVTRRTKFLLNKARDRSHILIGLFIAVSNIDRIVALIRSSSDSAEAAEKLLKERWAVGDVLKYIELVQDENNIIEDNHFYFSKVQVKAILDMRLARLTGLERGKIEDELKSLSDEIANLIAILEDKAKLDGVIIAELEDIKERYATPRRTVIETSFTDGGSIEDLIPKEDMVVTITLNGYIKRVPLSTYKSQRRGGKGRSAVNMNDEDVTTKIFVSNTHNYILFFSSLGRVYRLKVHELPLGSPQSKGRAIVNLLPYSADEKTSDVIELPMDQSQWSKINIVFATKDGTVRRNSMTDFTSINSSGKIAMKLDGDNELVRVILCDDDSDLFIVSKLGKAIRFPLEILRVFQSRASEGVRAIKLDQGDRVVYMSVLKSAKFDMEDREKFLKISTGDRAELAKELRKDGADIFAVQELDNKISALADSVALGKEAVKKMLVEEEFILTVTSNGYAKRSSAYEYRVTNRGGTGIRNIELSGKNGYVVSSFPVEDGDNIMLITKLGSSIRSSVDAVRITGRTTQGVTFQNIGNGDFVSSVAKIAKSQYNEDDNILDSENDGEEISE